jgi:hypothetical protein
VSYVLQYRRKPVKVCLNLPKTAAEAVLVLEIAATLLNQVNPHSLVRQVVNLKAAKALHHTQLNLKNYQVALAD